MGDVADALLLKHHSAVGLVDRAVAAGLVARHTDPADQRVVRLALTSVGEQRIQQLSRTHLEELRRLAPRARSLWSDLEVARASPSRAARARRRACRPSTCRRCRRRACRAGSPRWRTRARCPRAPRTPRPCPAARRRDSRSLIAAGGKKSSCSAKWPRTGADKVRPVGLALAERRAVVGRGRADLVALLRGDHERQHPAHAEPDHADLVARRRVVGAEEVDGARPCRARRDPSAASSSAARPCPSRCALRSRRGRGREPVRRSPRPPGGRTHL